MCLAQGHNTMTVVGIAIVLCPCAKNMNSLQSKTRKFEHTSKYISEWIAIQS